MKSISRFSQQGGFTLIELLVVISIIGILAGLSFTGVNGALAAARRAQAKNDCVQIVIAITAYETEYGKLPPGNFATVTKGLVETLTGQETDNNRRRHTFLEPKKATGNGRGGTNANGDYIDPWGNPYQIAMDTEYAGEIKAGAGSGKEEETLRTKSAVWCLQNANLRTPINSWD